MDCDYTGPNYSPEDLRSVIDAMCKSLESSGQIDEHEHPSAYSTLLDTAKWMAELEGQEPVAWVYDWQAPEGLIKGWVETNRDEIPEYANNIRPIYARPVPAEMSPDFTDTARAALLWVLWHHQGGSSPVGQPIRYALGMDAHEHLSKHQVQEAKRWAALTKAESNDFRQARTAPADPVNARLLEALSALLADIEALIGESSGVYGLHLNGDVSPWSELEEGGRFERLSSMSSAREAIAAESAPQAVRLTTAEIADAIRKDGAYEDQRAFQLIFPTLEVEARAIETAVLCKNGIEVVE